MLGDAIGNAVFLGFFFFGGLAALILGLTEPTHNPAAASVVGLAAGGGVFGMVFLAGPFLEALEDLWWAMGYSSGMLFTGRCKDSWWDDDEAPPEWKADLLPARDLAADLFKRAYIPNPAWLCLTFGYGALVLTILTAIATTALVVFPGSWVSGISALAGNVATVAWVSIYAIFVAVHRIRFRRTRWKKDKAIKQKVTEVIEHLGGRGRLGASILANCSGAGWFAPFAPGPRVVIGGLMVSMAITLAIRLWPYRHFLALSAAAALILLALVLVLWWHILAIRQALHPKRYSPCASLPLILLLRDAAKRRDRGAPWI